jgi:hypothetical protein
MNTSLVEVYSASSDAEAHIIKGLLESHGISCVLQPQAISSLNNILVPGTGAVNVLVGPASAEAARRLIEAD